MAMFYNTLVIIRSGYLVIAVQTRYRNPLM